jgi:hypothetical protein
MANTEVTYERTAIRDGSTQYFKVYVLCNDRGDLPDKYLFVKKIVDPSDPQQDVFERIAEIVDFDSTEGIVPNRNWALSQGATYFRDTGFTKLYTDLEVAAAAVQAIRDRLNTLTTDYETYDTDFVTTPTEEAEYPSTDPTTIEQLKTAYSTSRATYVAYESSGRDLEAQVELLLAKVELYGGLSADYSQWLEYIGDIKDLCNEALTSWKNYAGSAGSVLSDFLPRLDLFINNYIGVFSQYQEPTYQIPLDAAGYVDLQLSDVGEPVSQGAPGTSTGHLIGYDNNARTILVNPTDPNADDFTVSGTVTITVGSATSWSQSVSATAIAPIGAFGPNIQKLKADRDFLFTNSQGLTNTNSKFESTAIPAVELMESMVTTATLQNETLVNSTTRELSSVYEQSAELIAEAETAYTALQGAYDAVKAVCPSWTPDPIEVFPPKFSLGFTF